eukprot:TRINITY_DN1503_c0_g1_i2.p1 TRINITY_DN1503_c0_g1~~TRINITY_DN1503_c0_g1_i2.p1  ORF type:complete len:766 (+),score=189.24 TRINITY_DN1503_c0_g1_i2:137-2434(+)
MCAAPPATPRPDGGGGPRRRRRAAPPWVWVALAAAAALPWPASAVTCDIQLLWNGIGQCSLVCCGTLTCNCIQFLLDTGTVLDDGRTRIDSFKYCQYVSCLHDTIDGCPDEVADYQDVQAWYNYSSVDAAHTSSDGAPLTRIDFCNSRPCHWRDYNKFTQCVGALECMRVDAERCTPDCYQSVIRCMSTSSCSDLWNTEPECQEDPWNQCDELCPTIFALRTPAPTPAPPASPSSTNVGLIVGVVAGVSFVAGAVAFLIYWKKCRRSEERVHPASPPGQSPTTVEPADTEMSVGPGGALIHPSVRTNASKMTGMLTARSDATSVKAPAFIIKALSKGDWMKGQLLGRGQFGSVYLALLPHGQALAVKQIDASQQDEEETQTYVREIELMRSLDHPNIVKYYFASYEEADQLINLFMEYVPGGSLARLVRQMDDVLGEDQARAYTVQILHGLQYLHGHNIIHRDIKGDNVLIDTAGGQCKISDFGSSKNVQGTVGGTAAAAGTISGTPNWMAPEMIIQQGNLGRHASKADVWSVGCTVVEILNRGKPPWPPFQSLWAAVYHITHAEGLPDGIPETLSVSCRQFVEKCLIRDPVVRPSVTELLSHTWVLEGAHDQGSSGSEAPDCDDNIQKLIDEERQKRNEHRTPPSDVATPPSQALDAEPPLPGARGSLDVESLNLTASSGVQRGVLSPVAQKETSVDMRDATVSGKPLLGTTRSIGRVLIEVDPSDGGAKDGPSDGGAKVDPSDGGAKPSASSSDPTSAEPGPS